MFSSTAIASSLALERWERTDAESLCALSLCASALMVRDRGWPSGSAGGPPTLDAEGGPVRGPPPPPPPWPLAAATAAATMSLSDDAVRDTGPLVTLP